MHVVIVEPSSLGRRILTANLEARGLYVVSFSDAREAYAYIRDTETVDIVMTSFETEGMHGMELVWQCRLLVGDERALYIIAMSSGKEITKAIEALDCGADDFIRKPPVAEELGARLRSAERLISYQRDLAFYATRDPLTSLLNRRAFTMKVKSVLEQSFTSSPSCFMIADIDHFKQINDRYGHLAGDEVIKHVARIMESKAHIVGRFGGEEFALVVDSVEQDGAMALAETLRKDIEGSSILFEGARINATISIGVTQIGSGEYIDIQPIYKRADDALYQAKRNGRNCVHFASEDDNYLATDGLEAVALEPRRANG